MSQRDFTLPDLGEGVKGGDIVNVLVAEGDQVRAEQAVVEIETDKAVMEVPCSLAGTVVKVHVKQGEHVLVGATLLTIETDVGGTGSATEGKAKPATATPPASPPPAKPAVPVAVTSAAAPAPMPAPSKTPAASMASLAVTDEVVPAGPAARRLARELGVELQSVASANPGMRITEEIVKAFVKQGMESRAAGSGVAVGGGIAVPALPDFSRWGRIERVPFTSLQRKTADNLLAGWSMAPHVTQFDLCDITRLESLRKRFRDTPQGKDVKLTVTAFVVKALAVAIKAHPQFNASFDHRTNELIIKHYCHIGVAVDTEAGLIVPVLRDVDQKSVLQIALEMNEIAERTRKRKVTLEELRGGTFTVTNLGGIGGTAFTPIINYPEVAILGLARTREEPTMVNGELKTRLMLPLCLSYDHRVINGADGARFIRKLAELLEDPEILLLGTVS